MVSSILLAAVLVTQPSTPPTVGQLVREACVETEMNREAVERLAHERGWRSVRMRPSGSTEGWSVGYRVRDAHVALMSVPELGRVDPSVASICSVDAARPRGDWRAEIAELAADLGLQPDRIPDLPIEGEMRIWSTLGEYTLTSIYDRARGRVVVNLSRQLVLVGED
ncbi:hypothetical protein [Brevundimonas sp.]|uniref:hypothetical protein n=1 Tax=Brevundimonas sp. TaxID=1871086 RepID=UPI0039E59F68